MTRIFNLFEKGNKLINPTTGTIVITTGNHGDKTRGYQFEAYRITNGVVSDKPEWFRKMPFEKYQDN